jgi:hypothetical protein
MSPKTQEVYDAIKQAVAEGQDKITANIFSYCFNAASTSAAFRQAKKDGIIVVNYIGGNNNPVYKGAGT